MIIESYKIHNHKKDCFEISADKELYNEIVEDMVLNSGNFSPRSVWHKLEDASDPSTYESGAVRYKDEILSEHEVRLTARNLIDRYPHLSDLLDSWIGPRGKREEFDEKVVSKFLSYSKTVSGDFIQEYNKSQSYKIFVDHLTISEIGIINELFKEKCKVKILEVGGGYGRLCECIMNVFKGQVTYILADSVPISLMYSYLYLTKMLPDFNIGIYYIDEGKDFLEYDCYIMPTWKMETIFDNNGMKVDLSINIQSMQEMSQWHVDYFLTFFDKYSDPGSYIYLNNNEEYIFLGNWNIPPNWKMMFRHQTPWSWSDTCPTTVYLKDRENNEAWNSLASYEYQESIELRKRLKEQGLEIKRLSHNDEVISMLNNDLSELNSVLRMRDSQIEMLKNSQIEINEKNRIIENDLLRREAQIASLKQNKLKQNAQILRLQEKLALLREYVETKENELEVQSELICALEISEKEKSEENGLLRKLFDTENTRNQESKKEIETLTRNVNELSSISLEYKKTIKNLENKLNEKSKIILDLYRSNSWKITKPLRAAKEFAIYIKDLFGKNNES